jgi:RNA polymerase sigma factor (sigma-70 family)
MYREISQALGDVLYYDVDLQFVTSPLAASVPRSAIEPMALTEKTLGKVLRCRVNVIIEEQLLTSREKFLSFVQTRVSDHILAEDILQDSFLKALQRAPDLRDHDRLVPWFYRILRNAIIDAYRHQGVERKYTTEIAADEMPAAEMEEMTALCATALCACFYDLLPTLKSEYRELIQSELNEEKQESVASCLGISPSTLKVRRHRARQALRRRLEETCRMCATHGCLDCACHIQQASQ